MPFKYIWGCCRMRRIYAHSQVKSLPYDFLLFSWVPWTLWSLGCWWSMRDGRAGSSDHLTVCITFSSALRGQIKVLVTLCSLVILLWKQLYYHLPNISFVTPKHWSVWTTLFIPTLPVLWPQVLCTWSLDHLFPFASHREVMQACLRGHYTITRQAPRCLCSLWWQSWYSFYPPPNALSAVTT